VSGNLWQVNVEVGKPVREGDVLVVLESMKMEIPLLATRDGVVSRCVCSRSIGSRRAVCGRSGENSMMHPFDLRLDVLAQAYSEGRYTPREVITTLRERALALNPEFNAFIYILTSRAGAVPRGAGRS
jgi:hypothetical protein